MEPTSSLAKILAKQRERLGSPVSTEEIFRLHDAAVGEASISEEEREELLERVAADPEAARRLRDLLRFPDLEDEDSPDLEQVGARWQKFKAEISRDEDAAGLLPFQEMRRPVVPKRPGGWKAASFLLCAGLLFLLGRFSVPIDAPIKISSLSNPETLNLGPGSVTRSGAKRLVVKPESGAVIVSIDAPEIGEGPVTLRFVDESGLEAHLEPGLVPTDDGYIKMILLPQALTPGSYSVELYESRDEILATFFFELVVAP